MAKNRDSVSDPPVESEEESGEEEEASSEEEIEASESESEPEPPKTQSSQIIKKPSSTPAPAGTKPEPPSSKAQPSASSSADEDESGSETDSDDPVKKPDPNIKPIASKPMDDGQKSSTTKKPRSKPNPSGPTSPAKRTPGAGAKRPSVAAGGEDVEVNEAKRSKKKPKAEGETSEKKGNSNDDSKKLFQRLWSEDDEIAILKGMIDYYAKKKSDPVTDLSAFHEFIKKSLHIDVSRTQLQDKIRRLRKKYENNAGKEKKGKERVFPKAHEQKAYELSKKIWGNENNVGDKTIESPEVNGTAVKRSRSKNIGGMVPKVDAKVDEGEEEVNEVKSLGDKEAVEGLKSSCIGSGSLGIQEWIVKNAMECIKGEKREEMEEKWKKLMVEEAEVYEKKLLLILEQTRLVLDTLRSQGH